MGIDLIRSTHESSFYTFGCKVNQYETQVISQYFEADGFSIVPFSQEADVYLINSCTVTSSSDKRRSSWSGRQNAAILRRRSC